MYILFIGTYALGKRMLGVSDQAGLQYVQNFSMALIAGVVGAVAGNPFYTIKTRLQGMNDPSTVGW